MDRERLRRITNTVANTATTMSPHPPRTAKANGAHCDDKESRNRHRQIVRYEQPQASEAEWHRANYGMPLDIRMRQRAIQEVHRGRPVETADAGLELHRVWPRACPRQNSCRSAKLIRVSRANSDIPYSPSQHPNFMPEQQTFLSMITGSFSTPAAENPNRGDGSRLLMNTITSTRVTSIVT